MDAIAVWIGALAAAIAAIAAIASWRTARVSARVTKSLADIEVQRRHAELIPQFEIDTQRRSDDVILIYPRLVGPPALDRIDSLSLIVRDDTIDHSLDILTGPTLEQVDATIWGPYRLTPGVDAATHDGRSSGGYRLMLGDSRSFQFERTHPPSWTNDAWWNAQYGSAPIRLTLHCERDGYEPWNIPIEVKLPRTYKPS